MGTRYIMDVTCPECGHTATDCYYAPTRDFVTHVCESCGVEIDLGEYTGLSYEDASNAEKVRTIMAKCGTEEEVAKKLVEILDLYEGGTSLVSNQGQPLDGYSALANFVALAKEAKKLLLAMGTSAKIATESFEELSAAIAAYREMASRARGSHEESPALIGWILEPVDIFESQAGLRRAVSRKVAGE